MKNIYSIALLAATGALILTAASAPASETDDRIESAAKKSYVFKTYLKDDAITTVSKDGAVTLTGSVLESYHKVLAQHTVENLPGVKSVDNQLAVRPEAAPEHSDTWIGLKVKAALLFHRNVRATKTDVNVKDGVVTLTGEASSLAQKELTAEYVKDIEHVKEVKNEMTIYAGKDKPAQTAGEKLDDASITAQVTVSLMSHRSTSSFKTKVQTTDGVVTLTGIAKNAAEKSLVTKLVGEVFGVVEVVNSMSIETKPVPPMPATN